MRCDPPDRHTAPAAGQPRRQVREPALPPFAQPDPGLSVFLTVSASHPAWVYKPAARAAVGRFGFSALASVHPTTVPCRTVRCPRKSGCPLPLLRRWLYSVRRHTPKHLSDTPCRTVHRNAEVQRLSRRTVTPTTNHADYLEVEQD